jgi:hypothetical protein
MTRCAKTVSDEGGMAGLGKTPQFHRAATASVQVDLGLRPTSKKIRSWGRDATTCPSIETFLRNSKDYSLNDRQTHSRVLTCHRPDLPLRCYSSRRDSNAGDRIGPSGGGGAPVCPCPCLRIRSIVVTVLHCSPNRKARTGRQ